VKPSFSSSRADSLLARHEPRRHLLPISAPSLYGPALLPNCTSNRKPQPRTNVMRLIKHDNRILAHLLGDLFGDLGVEEVVEGVDDDRGVDELSAAVVEEKGMGGEGTWRVERREERGRRRKR